MGLGTLIFGSGETGQNIDDAIGQIFTGYKAFTPGANTTTGPTITAQIETPALNAELQNVQKNMLLIAGASLVAVVVVVAIVQSGKGPSPPAGGGG